MPNSLGDLVWFLAVSAVAITGTLVGVVYKGIDSRLADHDTRIRNLEITISGQLKEILDILDRK